jgi:hypothetical protein
MAQPRMNGLIHVISSWLELVVAKG